MLAISTGWKYSKDFTYILIAKIYENMQNMNVFILKSLQWNPIMILDLSVRHKLDYWILERYNQQVFFLGKESLAFNKLTTKLPGVVPQRLFIYCIV